MYEDLEYEYLREAAFIAEEKTRRMMDEWEESEERYNRKAAQINVIFPNQLKKENEDINYIESTF